MGINKETAMLALEKVLMDWYVPSFMTKLASYGIKTDDPVITSKLLILASTLDALNQRGLMQKSASTKNGIDSYVTNASKELEILLNKGNPQTEEVVEAAFAKKAAASDEGLRLASLILGYLASGGEIEASKEAAANTNQDSSANAQKT